MNYRVSGSAVLVQIVILSLFSLVLYVFMRSAAHTTALAVLRYAQEREQQASHGLFLYAVAYVKEHYDQIMPGEKKVLYLDQWPLDNKNSSAQITMTRNKNSISIESVLHLHHKDTKEQARVQLQSAGTKRWQITEWQMTS